MSPDFGANNVFGYTEEVQRIREQVNSNSENYTLHDCCDYRFQILDQYCSFRSPVSLKLGVNAAK